MRQIKFRAWDSDGKEMFRVVSMHFPSSGPIIVSGRGGSIGIDKGDALMQFTGLLDKNGKEIFEGDVVSDDSLVNDDGEKFKGEVGFNENEGAFDIVNSNCTCGMCDDKMVSKMGELEVIGNIYENPELLQ